MCDYIEYKKRTPRYILVSGGSQKFSVFKKCFIITPDTDPKFSLNEMDLYLQRIQILLAVMMMLISEHLIKHFFPPEIYLYFLSL